MLAALLAVAIAGPQIDLPPEEVARVCFVRTYRMVGMAVPFLIEADGRPLGKLGNRRFLCIDAEPGHYGFEVSGNFQATDGSYMVGDTRIQQYKTVHIERSGTIAAWGGQVTWLRVTQPAATFEVAPVEATWVAGRAVRPARAAQFIHPRGELLTAAVQESDEETMDVERIPNAVNRPR